MRERSFHIMTFGCQMNSRDSSWLAAMLRSRGFEETCLESASVILLNTCSVREKPELKVKSAISRVSGICGPGHLVGVLGCVAQQLGVKLFDFGAAVRLVAGSDALSHVPEAVERLLDDPSLRLDFLEFAENYPEREDVRESRQGGAAFVNIMQGCDNFCAYCIVPFTRGRQKSRAGAAILNECRACLEQGIVEITLLGQNVNAYGLDKKGAEPDFPRLLRQIAALPGLCRLRFVTPHPKDFDLETIRVFEEFPNVCPRLHLPLQSGSDRILKAMGRHYDRDGYLRLVERLLKARPDMALSTDLIVGFPGETERDFQDTLELMDACAFMFSFSFCYSDRPGTRASLMPDKIAREIMLERLGRLQEKQEALGQAWLAKRVGEKTSILIESPSPRQTALANSWQGRDPYGALVNVELAPGADHAGKTVEAIITEPKRHSLCAKVIL